MEPIQRLHIANRAEEARHYIEFATEVEICHIGLMKRDIWQSPASDVQHFLREVKPFHLKMRLQAIEMQPSTTRYIQ